MARLRALALVLAVFAAGCFGPSIEDERRMGREMSKEVESQIGVFPAKAEAWEALVGERLVAHLDPDDRYKWDFDFDIVDQLEPNAFALPGGHIYVSRGLLALLTSEDELACVLGHEITHVTERHATARAKQSILPAILTFPGRLVGVVNRGLGNLVAAPFEVLGELHLARYSRGEESEADRKGAELAARSGYDPRALATILDRLEKDATRLAGRERRSSFFDDHPSTPSRIEDVNDQARKIKWAKQAPLATWPDLLAQLDGIPWGENPAQGVFRGNLYLHPDLGFAVQFPAGWRTVNTPSLAGAMRDREAVVAISIAGMATDPETEGKAFVERLRREEIEPDEARTAVVNGYPAYVVTISDRDSDARVYVLWVRMGLLTYRFVAIGGNKDKPALRGTIESLRPITEEERASIEVVRIRSARAKRREPLARVAGSADDAWPVPYTAMLNGLGADAVLEEGALLKIALREPYVTSPQR